MTSPFTSTVGGPSVVTAPAVPPGHPDYPSALQAFFANTAARGKTTRYIVDPEGTPVEMTFNLITGKVSFNNGTDVVELPFVKL